MDAEEDRKISNRSICVRITSLHVYLKRYGYTHSIKKTLKFLLHFFTVMIILFCGAAVLAILEDGDIIMWQGINHNHAPRNETPSSRKQGNITTKGKAETFWEHIELTYNISIQPNLRMQLHKEVCSFSLPNEHLAFDRGNHEHIPDKPVHDRYYIFMKWFYFATTSTTTIGYGHVHPKTDNGKLFYIFFSVIGIALMMTLLKSCGNIITDINKRVYSTLGHHFFRGKKLVSDELMAVFTIILLFVVFMLFVVWHDQEMDEATKWSHIDCFYFWMVTFTTVGFGDVHFSLEEEVDHVYEMLLYRICGLAFLAGIIDSIQGYMKFRNKVIVKNISRGSVQFRHKIIQRKASKAERKRSQVSSRGSESEGDTTSIRNSLVCPEVEKYENLKVKWSKMHRQKLRKKRRFKFDHIKQQQKQQTLHSNQDPKRFSWQKTPPTTRVNRNSNNSGDTMTKSDPPLVFQGNHEVTQKSP